MNQLGPLKYRLKVQAEPWRTSASDTSTPSQATAPTLRPYVLLGQALWQFAVDRDWEQFNSPMNLILAP